MADSVDEDTEAAVIALWSATPALAELCKQHPQSGRLHSPKAKPLDLPYAQVNSEALPGKVTRYVGGFRKEARKVTLTLRGTHPQAATGLALMLGTFNAQLSAPGKPTLTFPSTSPTTNLPYFVKWWPTNEGTLKQEETARQGVEVWAAVIEAEVWSTRSDT